MAEVIVSSVGYLKQQIKAGRHTFFADEPLESGGGDTAPDPYSLLLGALGACTAMTLQLYARRKQWALEQVEVKLKHSRVYAQDCADCKGPREKIDRIDRQISLTGELDEAQKTRLLQIAEQCPVHKTLTSGVSIETHLY
jgi:putative redox protein